MAISIDLSGQTALITGASGELGRVMARTLAEAGAAVVCHYHRSGERAQQLVDELVAAGHRAVALAADVSVRDEVFALRDEIEALVGAPDIVVANAVGQYEWTTILEQAGEDFQGQFETCVMQSVWLAQAFVPAMVERGRGRFIATNTECAIQTLPRQGAYASAKRGLDGLLRVLMREVGPGGVTVNQVAPGWTITERERVSGDSDDGSYRAGVPLRRRGSDQEIANVVLFLASELASYVTGAFIPVCGGNAIPAI